MPFGGQPDLLCEVDFVLLEVWMDAIMLNLNPDGEFNEEDFNQKYRRLSLVLHPDAAARNESHWKK